MNDFPLIVKVYDLGGTGVRIRVEQDECGGIDLYFDKSDSNYCALQLHRADIAALGFPTEPPEPSVEVAEEVK